MQLNSILFLASYIEKETGIVFQETNLYQLRTRLEEIVKKEKLSSIEELARKFRDTEVDRSLKQRLLDQATNNETLFFRDPVFFKAMQNFILNYVKSEKPSDLKIWSAAASSGQEAVSLAIALDELSESHNLPPVSIVATDLSQKMVSKIESGLYLEFEIMRGLSDERREKYFSRAGEAWKVNPSIHSKIRVQQNNLITNSITDVFDLILCRNVLIYQKVEVKKMVVNNLYRQLSPGGAILLGVGETLLGIKDDIDYTLVDDVIFYKKPRRDSKIAA